MPSNDYKHHVSDEQRKRRIKRFILEILVSALLIIPATIFACIYWKGLVTDSVIGKILDNVKLQPGSTGFNNWLHPPATVTRSYYLFNVTNPIDIVTEPSSTKIRLQDTPPYTYTVNTIKKNISWSNDNKKIDYAVERLFARDPTRFVPSSVNDTGVFVDLYRALFRTQYEKKPDRSFFHLSGMNTFYPGNAIEQLEGFTSDSFKLLRDKMYGPNTEKGGFIYRQNGSQLYNVSIETDLTKKGQVLTFASKLVPFKILSPSRYSFPIYDSVTYPPMLFDKPLLNIFNSDFCSPLLLEFNKQIYMYGSIFMIGGINMFEYKIKLVDIKNCTNPNDTSTCNEVDKLDVSKCISDSLPENTIFLSKAHFYGSTKDTIEEMNIEGFTPTSDKHDSVVYFEPYTGSPFKASFRMQLNIDAMIDPMRESEYGSGLEPTKRKGVKRLLPIFWIDQDITISEEVISKLQKPLYVLRNGQYIIVGLAIALSIGFVVLMELLAKRSAKSHRYTRGVYVTADTLIHR